jgi:transglutaminase-like putative cysteine protease
MPARYVTGYLATETEDESEAHHAWAEAWIDGLGWVGFDVANNLCPTETYVRLTTGLDASTAAPITGSRRGGGKESMSVSVVAHGKVTPSQSQSQSQG